MMSYGRMIFLHDTSRSYVSMEMDGSVTVRAGVQDIEVGRHPLWLRLLLRFWSFS